MTDYALAAKKIELTRKQIDLIISLRWTVSPDPDLGFRQGCACPFCPGATARETEFERRFYLTPDWLEKPEDEDSKMMIQEVAGYFLAKELKSVGAEFVVSAARSALPKSDWRWVEAYRCSEHGEFLEVLDDDEGGFSVANPRMLIRREGLPKRANLRFAACTTVIEAVDLRGEVVRYDWCLHIAEWHEAAPVGACSWTCPWHGTWGVLDDGTEFGPETRIDRRTLLGPEPRPSAFDRLRRKWSGSHHD